MTKLYSCNAKIADNRTLVSYSTEVVNFGIVNKKLYCSIYRASTTTMSHIRKYVEWLNEHNEELFANLLEYTYKTSVEKKFHTYTCFYNRETGTVDELVGRYSN